MAKFVKIGVNGSTVTYRQERSNISFRCNVSMFVGDAPESIEIVADNIHEPYLEDAPAVDKSAKEAERKAAKEKKDAERAATKEQKAAEAARVKEAKRAAAAKVREDAKAAAKAAAAAALDSVPPTPQEAAPASA